MENAEIKNAIWAKCLKCTRSKVGADWCEGKFLAAWLAGRGVLADTAAGIAGQPEAGIRVVRRRAILLVAHRGLRVEEREAVVRERLQLGEFISPDWISISFQGSNLRTRSKFSTFFSYFYLEAVAGAGDVAAGSLEASALAVVHAGLELETGVTVAGAHERAHTGSSIAVRFREAGHVQGAGSVASGEGLQQQKKVKIHSLEYSGVRFTPFTIVFFRFLES